mgnify:FL=1
MQASLGKIGDIQVGAAPAAFNWGDYCALTDIKNQGQCGACWAFSSTAAAESLIKTRNGTDTDLSE